MTEVAAHEKGLAAIAAVSRCSQALERTVHRPGALPGLVVYHGRAGLGKTFAAAYLAVRFKCAHIEARSMWTKKDTVRKLALELGVDAVGTIVRIAERCAEELALSGRGVIFDDFDNIVGREGQVELVRDLYEMSSAPMMIIGEERLPIKLERYERFHGRVLEFVQAPFADVADARALAAVYAPGVGFDDDALQHLVEVTGGSVRRLAVNLELIRARAAGRGLDRIAKAAIADWQLSTGRSPEPRR